MTEKRGVSLHKRRVFFNKFVDVSEVLEPSPSARMAWRSNFTTC